MIRFPHPGDWAEVLVLAHAMHEESWFKDFDFSEQKINAIFHKTLEDRDWLGLVAVHQEKLIGFFCGVAIEHFFGFDRYACDLVMYVTPPHRGGSSAYKFIKMYETWCAARKVKEIHIGTSTQVASEKTAKFYQKMGYHSPAMGFRKKTYIEAAAE